MGKKLLMLSKGSINYDQQNSNGMAFVIDKQDDAQLLLFSCKSAKFVFLFSFFVCWGNVLKSTEISFY